MIRFSKFVFVLFALSLGACSKLSKTLHSKETAVKPKDIPESITIKATSIEAFGSEDEFKEYMGRIANELAKRQASQSSEQSAASDNMASPASTSEGSGVANETITNNQEAGVDEGGIVKNIGDSLVVLRKGRLYAVSLANSSMSETHAIDVAKDLSLNSSVWYDELLVSGDRLYVVGYRYQTSNSQPMDLPAGESQKACRRYTYGATEINSFRLKAGKFERLTTSLIESYDYFSGHNYASRMVDGKLVFYMPQSAFESCGSEFSIKIPQYLSFNLQKGFFPIKPLFSGMDVFKNIESMGYSPIFHTLVNCQLPEDGSLDCQAKAVLGTYSREKYVSPGAVYLASENKVYALNLKDQTVRAHAFSGQPLDQFSFKEQNGQLHILVQKFHRVSRAEGGDIVSSNDSVVSSSQPIGVPTRSSCSLELYSLPIAGFDNMGAQALDSLHTKIHEGPSCNLQKNRYVGNHVLFASGAELNQSDLHAFHIEQKTHRKLRIPGSVSRLEVLRDSVAFVGTNVLMDARTYRQNLVIGTLKLDEADLWWESQSLGAVAEGESRSHGFFQKPEAEGSHVLGLPVISNQGMQGAWWGNGLSNVAFLRVGQDLKLKLLGLAESGSDTRVCQSSCVDWYGNTRPIFLGTRIFALMGHEIAEVKVEGDLVQTIGTRLRFSEVR